MGQVLTHFFLSDAGTFILVVSFIFGLIAFLIFLACLGDIIKSFQNHHKVMKEKEIEKIQEQRKLIEAQIKLNNQSSQVKQPSNYYSEGYQQQLPPMEQ